MLLQSNHNLYSYNHQSKYLFPLHPIVAFLALEARKGKNVDLKEVEKKFIKDYTNKEINLFYQQYLYLKEQLCFEADISKIYGIAGGEWIRESFYSKKQIVFEVTEGCNLQCTYCAYGDFYVNRGERKGKTLDFALAKTLLSHFIPLWKEAVINKTTKQIAIGFYGGEPLLNYELIAQIVEYCESLGFEKDFFRFSMTTNGILIKKYRDFLIDKNIHITVSLDGNKENNSYRVLKTGDNSFDKIIDGVNSLKEKNEEYFEKNVEFITVIHDKNSLENTYNFIKNYYGKIPSISPLSTENVDPLKQEAFDKMYKDFMSDVTGDFLLSLTDSELGKYDFLSTLRKNCQYHFEYFMSVYNAKRKMPTLPTGTCVPFSRKTFLTTEGKILPCEMISINHAIGNVDEEKGITLDFDAIADYFNGTTSKYKEECKNCYNKNGCGFCAFKSSEDKCSEFMDEQKFVETMAFYLAFVEKYPHLYKYTKNLIIG